MHPTTTLAAAALLLAALPAQTAVVVPNGYADLEGTSAARTPFGWTSGRVQYLVDGAQLCQSIAVLTNVQFRLDGGNFNIDAPTGKTFTATLIAYDVPIAPGAMTNTWTTNVGAATGTTLFQGTLTVPGANRQYPYPNPWTIDIPFAQPYVYQRQNGNLLLDLTVTGGSADNWPADGFFLHRSEARGEISAIWQDGACTNGRGDALELAVPQVANNGVLGGQLTVQHTATPAPGGAIDFVYHVLSLDNRSSNAQPLPVQLGSLGFGNCQLNVDPQVGQLLATSTGQCIWNLPGSTQFLGTALFTQAVGFDATAGVAVPSQNAFQIRIADSVPPASGPAQMVHQANYAAQTTGALSPTGYYGLVARFVGSFQ